MDKLSEIIKIPMLREGQPYKEYLDLLAVTLRNMLELMTQNSNILQQIIINEGGGGVVNHHALAGLHTANDHRAADIENIAAGGIAAITVQAALNELDGDKSNTGHTHNHTILTDIGTNTHAQIDSHIGAAAPHSGHMDKPASPEQGDVLYYNGSTWARLVHGSVGEFLTTGGHGADPSWSVASLLGSLSLPTHLHYDADTQDNVNTYDEKTEYPSNAPTITLGSGDLGQLHIMEFSGNATVVLPAPGSAGKIIGIAMYVWSTTGNVTVNAATGGSIWTYAGKVVQNSGGYILLYGPAAEAADGTPLILISRSATDWSIFNMPAIIGYSAS
jgi:hypothetical protein